MGSHVGSGLCGALCAVVMGCAAAGAPAPRGAADGRTAVLPWELPASALGTQRVLRARYAGPEMDAVVRLVLRLEAADRFQLQAADRLGRAVWDLQLVGGDVFWVDHQGELVCRGLPERGLPPGLGDPLPVAELPAVLLGVLPARPADPAAAGDGRELAFVDRLGRRWSGRLDRDGALAEWALWSGTRPEWRFQVRDGGGVLWQPDGGRRLEWTAGVVEPLTGLTPLSVPGSYREECGG